MTPPRLQPDRIQALLNDELRLDPCNLTVLRPGAWSAAYAFTSAEREWVIRFSDHGDDFDRDAFAFRFASDVLPVPRVTHRGTWDGVQYAISERSPGGFLDDLTADGLTQTLPSLVNTLDALRTADVSGTTEFGGWDSNGNGTSESWPAFIRNSLEDSPTYRGGSWRPKLEASPTGATAFDRDVLVLDRRLQDIPNVRHVIHCDLINFNVLVEDHAISGVIDWGCALYGDFLYELAWFGFWWPWYPQWVGVDVVQAGMERYASAGADLHAAEERLLVYKLHIGLTHQSYNASIGEWDMLEHITRVTTSIADELR